MLKPIIHYGIHLLLPLAVALLFYRKNWFKAYLTFFVCSILIHICLNSLQFFVIDHNKNWDRKTLLNKESHYQHFFNTLSPKGLNDIENFNSKPFVKRFILPYNIYVISILNPLPLSASIWYRVNPHNTVNE